MSFEWGLAVLCFAAWSTITAALKHFASTIARLVLTPAVSSANSPGTAALADLNGNGSLDLAFTGSNEGCVSVRLNTTPPILQITRSAGYHQVTWSATLSLGFNLEYTTNLSALDSWQPFPYPPVQIGSQKAVTDWTDRERRLYRLRKP